MFWKTFAAVMLGVIAAANAKPVLDYGSRRLAIRLLAIRAVQKAEKREHRPSDHDRADAWMRKQYERMGER